MRAKTNLVTNESLSHEPSNAPLRKASSLEQHRHRARALSGPTEPRVGRLVGFDARGRLLVEVSGQRAPLPARSLLRLDQALRQAVLRRAEVLLLFEAGDRRKPIVAGVLQPTAQDPTPAQITSLTEPRDDAPRSLSLEADADGKRVRLTAQDEIVLECGKASITLRRNGRISIRGVEVDSSAVGTHRIRGGQVRLN